MAQIIGAGGQPIQPKEDTPLDLTKTESVACKKCGGEIFIQGFSFRRVPRLLTGKPKDEMLPVELFLCGDCGEVLNDLLPNGLKMEE
jgi:DNA-directed RNA polymerase subunit RPC12/RpoP